MRSDVVRLFQTLPHPCGYFAERTAQNIVIDPSASQLPQIYDLAVQRGYRRAGGHVYHPHCMGCRACVACRVPVERFVPDHSGANYAPHLTLGRARAGFLRELQRAPFDAFVLSPAAIAVHRLGNHGTARRRLWRWPAQ